MNRVYLDTSAYLAILLRESGFAKLQSQIGNRLLCSSTLLLIEAERNLIHLVRNAALSTDDYEQAFAQLLRDKELFILRDVTPDLCLTRHLPIARTPKSADLIHLRTALWFRENGGCDRFISTDNNQLKAAEEMGLS